METEVKPGQSTQPHSFTVTVPHFLVRWYRGLPASIWRAALLVFALGFGIGCGSFALKESLAWYRNRPLPPLPDRKWSEFNFPEYGLKAKLSTKWDEPINKLTFKLTLMPSDGTDSEEFFNRLSRAQHALSMAQVTLNVYDKRHFVVQSSDEYLSLFASVIDKEGKPHLAVKQGELYISRDQYAALSSWDLTVNGLQPANRNTASETHSDAGATAKTAPLHPKPTSEGPRTARGDSTNAGSQAHPPEEGDDVASGYDMRVNAIDTSAGRAFVIYKEGEHITAIVDWMSGTHFHYNCDEKSMCLLTKDDSGLVLHARLRR